MADKVFAIPNVQTPSVPVRIAWEDADNQDGIRPESVTVTLTDAAGNPIVDAEGNPITRELSADNNYAVSFDGLTVVDADGNEIEYRVAQVTPGGYAVLAKERAADVAQFTLTDRRTPQEVYAAIRANGQEVVFKNWDSRI